MKQSLAIFTQFDSAFKPVADITLPVLSAYCERHGYALHVAQNPKLTRDIVWDRVLHLQRGMYFGYDWVVHFDSDVLVTNPEWSFDSLIHDSDDIIISRDSNSFNDGVVLFRNASEVCRAISLMWKMYGEPGVYCAQDALRNLIAIDAKVKQAVREVPQKRLNAYLYAEYGLPETTPGQWEPGDFCLHLPGRTTERRCEIFKNLLRR